MNFFSGINPARDSVLFISELFKCYGESLNFLETSG